MGKKSNKYLLHFFLEGRGDIFKRAAPVLNPALPVISVGKIKIKKYD